MHRRARRFTAAGLSASVAALGLVATAPAGQASGVVASPSTTTLALDRTSSAYGQQVTATARVTTGADGPAGGVAFSVDGLATMAEVGPDGVATLVLPAAHAGTHTVTATFVPTDPVTYAGSTSADQGWIVSKAATSARISVTGRTTRVPTTVTVRVKGDYGSVPTGTVRITIRPTGHRGTLHRVRTLDRAGSAQVGFGRLANGRYTLTVVHHGDRDHRRLRKTTTFRVTRR